jgi:hypothetical protein
LRQIKKRTVSQPFAIAFPALSHCNDVLGEDCARSGRIIIGHLRSLALLDPFPSIVQRVLQDTDLVRTECVRRKLFKKPPHGRPPTPGEGKESELPAFCLSTLDRKSSSAAPIFLGLARDGFRKSSGSLAIFAAIRPRLILQLGRQSSPPPILINAGVSLIRIRDGAPRLIVFIEVPGRLIWPPCFRNGAQRLIVFIEGPGRIVGRDTCRHCENSLASKPTILTDSGFHLAPP